MGQWAIELLRTVSHFHILEAFLDRQRFTCGLNILKIKFDGFLYVIERFRAGFALGNATWKGPEL